MVSPENIFLRDARRFRTGRRLCCSCGGWRGSSSPGSFCTHPCDPVRTKRQATTTRRGIRTLRCSQSCASSTSLSTERRSASRTIGRRWGYRSVRTRRASGSTGASGSTAYRLLCEPSSCRYHISFQQYRIKAKTHVCGLIGLVLALFRLELGLPLVVLLESGRRGPNDARLGRRAGL